MVIVLLILFYCVDDWLAAVTQTPWVGQIPLVPAIVIALILSVLGHLISGDRRP